MAASQGVNVLRYSALFFGLIYGVTHQASLTAQSKVVEIDREYRFKVDLIRQAKAAYSKKYAPVETSHLTPKIDPNDSEFDLEAYLKVNE